MGIIDGNKDGLKVIAGDSLEETADVGMIVVFIVGRNKVVGKLVGTRVGVLE